MGVRAWILALAVAGAAPAAAQTNPFLPPPVVSTAPAVPAVVQGTPLPITGGPWVLNQYLFFSKNAVVSDYAWRDRLRGHPGQLYTASDLQDDVAALKELKKFDRVTPAVYAIPDTPVPPAFAGISASTSQVRVVFDVDLVQSSAPVTRLVTPPSAVSGMILTPTAYRGAGKHNTPGMGLDVNAAYFIGRLYGKNDYVDAPERTNYLDRIGLWTFTVDGKMQIQSDGPWRPAVAVGGQGMFLFRDSGQPSITTPSVSVKANAKSTQLLSDGYVVASKNVHGLRASVGVMQGNIGNFVSNLSEFLTPEALHFYNREPAGIMVSARTVPFASLLYLRKPDYPIGVEIMKFNGSPANPWLMDFKLGRLLHLNFDLALLKFQGGYDVLGLIQFRYNHFPRD